MKPTPQDWQQAFALLDQALELPAEGRSAWLDALPAERGALRPLLQRLLADRRRIETDDFLGSGAAPVVTRKPDDAGRSDGAVFGPWRLLRRLGEGGMAEVWLAERADGAHRRTVALKLPFVQGSRAQVVAERFERERDILSGLSHPHIAAVLDAGTHQGQPWLAMEFVDGVPLTAHCVDGNLPLRARLQLFLQVLAAVQHAHGRLVIHRDLKPSNVLVDAGGMVKLLDFGVAKLLQDDGVAHATELTREGGRAMTPQYASPEQIMGRPLGTASDVYALGVLLYEVLTGALPYRLKRDTPAALEEAIVQADVAPPSRAVSAVALRRALQGDVDTIVMKAIEPQPQARYDSAQALAADIEAHLAIRPIAARPVGAMARALKWARRNALVSAAVAAVVLALAGGAAATAWQYQSARDEALRAERAKRFVLSIFEDADYTAGAGKDTTARELLEQAQQRVPREFGNDFATQLELQSSLAYSLLGQGAPDRASKALEPLLTRARGELGPLHAQTLRAQRVLGEAWVNVGRSAEAAPLLQQAADGALRAGEHATRVGALQWLASALVDTGATAEANLAAEQATALADRPDSKVSLHDRFFAWNGAANIRASTGRPGVAEAAERALVIGQQLFGDRDITPVLFTRVMLGRGQYAEGRYAEAEATLRSAHQRLQALHGPQHYNVIATTRYLAAAQRELGQLPQALASFREVLAALEVTDAGKPTVRLAIAHGNIADTLNQVGRPDEAMAAGRRARELFEQTGGLAQTTARPARLAWADTLVALGRHVEAEAELSALLATVPSGDAVPRARIESPLAVLRARRGDAAAPAAAQAAEAALASAPALVRGRAALDLGRTLLAAGQSQAAAQAIERALPLLRQAQPQGGPWVTAAEQALAQAGR